LNNFAIQETDGSSLPHAANFYALVMSCTWQWKCLPGWWENTVIGKLHGIYHKFLMFHVVQCDIYLLSLIESQLYYICMSLNKENMNNYCKMFGANYFFVVKVSYWLSACFRSIPAVLANPCLIIVWCRNIKKITRLERSAHHAFRNKYPIIASLMTRWEYVLLNRL